MRKVTLLVISFLLLFSLGCASKDYVRQQIDPLIDRISKLEARVSAIESKVNALEGKVAEIDVAKNEPGSQIPGSGCDEDRERVL